MAGREYDYFPPLAHALEKRDGVRTNVDTHLDGAAVDLDGQLQIGSCRTLFEAVDEGFIEVKQ